MSAPPTLQAVDAELAAWRDRLAAASRNVSELTELPEYAVARAAARGVGPLAEEVRRLVATVDELWQGVLLIGAALDRAEAARHRGSRLWRGEEAAAEAMAVLHGPSVVVDLTDTPVLHRRLLAGPRATATVSPPVLLQTMEAAFDRARARLARVTEASRLAEALAVRLAGLAAGLPELASRLAAVPSGDALERLEALEALRPAVEVAAAAMERARAGLAAARGALGALAAAAAGARALEARCQATVVCELPEMGDAVAELTGWLGRIEGTVAAGRLGPAAIGLGNWMALHDRAAADAARLAAAAQAGLARLDELRARVRALAAKARARGADMAGLVETAALLERVPVDLAAAGASVAAAQAALAVV